MNTDSGELEPAAPRPGFDLPRVIGVRIRRIACEPRQPRNFTSSLPQSDHAIEFLVETDMPIPIRALGPALYVGDTPVLEVVAEDPTHYRFLGLQPEALKPGAPLSLGWSGKPEQRQETSFRYEGG